MERAENSMANNPRREFLPIPQNLTPDGRVCFCINLPDDPEHFAAFWGALSYLGKRYAWGKPLTSDSEIVARYWADIIADNRACFEGVISMANRGCGCEETVTRYTAAGVLQQSTDGGQTWQNDLTDPRFYGSVLPPPLWLVADPAGDHSCEGASTAAANMHKLSDEILDNAPTVVAEIATVITGIICVYTAGAGCAIAGVVEGIVSLITLLGASTIKADLTAEDYARLRCILYCNIGADATFSESQWNAVKQDISEQLNGTPETWFWNMVNIIGPVGLTNLARVSITANTDCSDCACSCDDVSIGSIGENLIHRPDLGVGWWQVTTVDGGNPNDNTYGRYYAEILSPACCRHVDYHNVGGQPADPGHRVAYDCNGDPGDPSNYLVSGCVSKILFRSFSATIFEFCLTDNC